jgi:type IV secretory pathway VirB2 component (pilin)
MQRKVLNWKAVTSAACIMLVYSAVVYAQGTAYGSDIKTAATNLYATMRGIGGVVMAIGLSMCGFKIFVQHDTEHLKSALLVVAGGVLIMVAPSLVSMLQSVTSGTTQTFQ